jgi:hypothetical protein
VESKDLWARTKEGFDDSESQAAEQFIDRLLNSWKEETTSVKRIMLSVVILAGVFELMAHAGALEFNFGPTKVTDSSLIQKALPALLAYLVFDGLATTHRALSKRIVYSELMKRFHPKMYESDLELLVAPASHAFWEVGEIAGVRAGSRSAKFFDNVNAALALSMLLSIVLFEGYAYYILFRKFQAEDILLWASAIVASIFLLMAALLFTRLWQD